MSEQLLGVIKGRRSVRRFRNQPVPHAALERLIEAASWAPSATNRQDWFFSVVETQERKAEIAEAVRSRWREIVESHKEMAGIEEVERYAEFFTGFERAPAVVAVSAAVPGAMQRELLGDLTVAVAGSFTSAAMAAQNLMLAAHAMGLATCCLTGALAAAAGILGILDLGRRRELVCLIAVGYDDEHPEAPPRRPVTEIVRYW